MEIFKLVGRVALEGMEKVNTGLKETEGKLNKLSEGLGKAGKKTKEVGGNLTKWLTLPITGAGAGIVAVTKQTGDYADRILDLNAITGMSTDEIQRWQQVAKVAGVNSEFMTNASMQLTKQMTRLKDGQGKASESLEELGVTYEELEKATPDEQMNILMEALAGIEDPSERARLGTDLFRGAYQDLAPVLTMSADQIDDVKKSADDMGSVMSGDALNDANDFRVEMEHMQTKIGNLVRDIATTFLPIIMDELIPLIERGIEKVKEWANWFTGLDDNQKKLILTIAGLIAILGPALVVIGTVITIVGKLVGVINMVRKAMLLFNTTLLASPITWIILGIVALIAIGVLLWQNWDEIVAKLTQAWEWLKEKWNSFVELVKTKTSELWTKVKEYFIGLKDDIITAVTNAWTSVVDKFTGIKDTVVEMVTGAYNTAKETFDNIVSAIVDPIETAWGKIKEWVDKILGLFDWEWEIPKPKWPKISVSMKENSWGIPYPSFSVSWHKRGGFFDNPSIVGLGEAGREAIVPLENERYMRPFAEAIAKQLPNNAEDRGGTITVPLYVDGKEFARAVAPSMDRELERGRRISNRGRGMIF